MEGKIWLFAYWTVLNGAAAWSCSKRKRVPALLLKVEVWIKPVMSMGGRPPPPGSWLVLMADPQLGRPQLPAAREFS